MKEAYQFERTLLTLEALKEIMEYLGWITTLLALIEVLVAVVLKRELFLRRLLALIMKLLEIDPYSLDGEALKFNLVPELIKRGDLRSDDGTTKLAFVAGSCRDETSPGTHSAVCTDLFFTPEISLAWSSLCDGRATVATMFDIDVDEECKQDWNFVLTGGAIINRTIADVCEFYGNRLKVRLSTTGLGLIGLSEASRHYTPEESPRVGALMLCANPWAATKRRKRLIMICFGTAATGTMAALKLLLDYLTTPSKAENNLIDPSVPAKVVRAELKSYTQRLKNPNAVIPSFDVRGLRTVVCIE